MPGSHLRVAVCWNYHQEIFGGSGMAATFGWLCVETMMKLVIIKPSFKQPPSGGCVLKRIRIISSSTSIGSHLRVAVCWNALRQNANKSCACSHLRVAVCWNPYIENYPYFFWCSHLRVAVCWNPAWNDDGAVRVAATFGWLCVETSLLALSRSFFAGSHLRVAVCWNFYSLGHTPESLSSHLRVAVCWN